MTLDEFTKSCWKYYQVLVSDFMRLSWYVAFEEDNEKCHSVEF